MQKSYLGIDVSKATFDAAILVFINGEKKDIVTAKFSNDEAGLKGFKKWLKELGVSVGDDSLLVIENTGIYHRRIWQFCSAQNLPIYIGNAAHLKWSFGIARGKNDQVDAVRLCQHAYKNADELKATPPLDKRLLTLKDLQSNRSKLLRQKNAIKQTLGELKTSNDVATQKLMQKLNKDATDGLTKSIKLIEAEIKKIMTETSEFKTNFKLLMSVPGIGKITAAFLIGCTNNFQAKPTGKQLSAYAGVVPFEHSSGTSVKGRNRVHYMANKELKSILTMGALSAIENYDEFGDYYNRKIMQGKKHLEVLNAIKNKMLLRAVSVINNQQPYVDNYKKAC